MAKGCNNESENLDMLWRMGMMKSKKFYRGESTTNPQ